MFGIISGSGLYEMVRGEERKIITPFGEADVTLGAVQGKPLAFIARHGKSHTLPPHKVNYRANIYALNTLRVQGIIATSACGVIDRFEPGDLILPDDFIALTLGPVTFFDDFQAGIKHIDLTSPFDENLASAVKSAARAEGVEIKSGGTIATVPGPRFETRAEIGALKKMGASLVSMTQAYEAILARELDIKFASLAIATNYACGVSKKPLDYEEARALAGKKEDDIKRIIARLVGTGGIE
ncbi:MAG: MTAP family purine nucleoside phosphorylase [Candidatus Micrarchaeota archaeon]